PFSPQGKGPPCAHLPDYVQGHGLAESSARTGKWWVSRQPACGRHVETVRSERSRRGTYAGTEPASHQLGENTRCADEQWPDGPFLPHCRPHSRPRRRETSHLA